MLGSGVGSSELLPGLQKAGIPRDSGGWSMFVVDPSCCQRGFAHLFLYPQLEM